MYKYLVSCFEDQVIASILKLKQSEQYFLLVSFVNITDFCNRVK